MPYRVIDSIMKKISILWLVFLLSFSAMTPRGGALAPSSSIASVQIIRPPFQKRENNKPLEDDVSQDSSGTSFSSGISLRAEKGERDSSYKNFKREAHRQMEAFLGYTLWYYAFYLLCYILAVFSLDIFITLLTVLFLFLEKWNTGGALIATYVVIGGILVILLSFDTITGEIVKVSLKNKMLRKSERLRERSLFYKRMEKNEYFKTDLIGQDFIKFIVKRGVDNAIIPSRMLQIIMYMMYIQNKSLSEEEKRELCRACFEVFPKNKHLQVLVEGGTLNSPEYFMEKKFLGLALKKPEFNPQEPKNSPYNKRAKRWAVFFYGLLYFVVMIVPTLIFFLLLHSYTLNILSHLLKDIKIFISVIIGGGYLMFKQLTKGTLRRVTRRYAYRQHEHKRLPRSDLKDAYTYFLAKWESKRHYQGSHERTVTKVFLEYLQSCALSIDDICILGEHIAERHLVSPFFKDRWPTFLNLIQAYYDDMNIKNLRKVMIFLDQGMKKESPENVWVMMEWAHFLLYDMAQKFYIMDRGRYRLLMQHLSLVRSKVRWEEFFKENFTFTEEQCSFKGFIFNFRIAEYNILYLTVLLIAFIVIAFGMGYLSADVTLPGLAAHTSDILKAVLISVLLSSLRSVIIRIFKDPIERWIDKKSIHSHGGYRRRYYVWQKKVQAFQAQFENKIYFKKKRRNVIAILAIATCVVIILLGIFVSKYIFILLPILGFVVLLQEAVMMYIQQIQMCSFYKEGEEHFFTLLEKNTVLKNSKNSKEWMKKIELGISCDKSLSVNFEKSDDDDFQESTSENDCQIIREGTDENEDDDFRGSTEEEGAINREGRGDFFDIQRPYQVEQRENRELWAA